MMKNYLGTPNFGVRAPVETGPWARLATIGFFTSMILQQPSSGAEQGKRVRRWNGSRREPWRRAERRVGMCRTLRWRHSRRPLRAGGFGRSATKPTSAVLLAFLLWMSLPCGAESGLQPGLAVRFGAGDQKDLATLPGVALHVESGQPPTPFLPGGAFTAVWEGSIHADLRGNHHFQAELNGSLKVEINGAVALEATGNGRASALSRPVPLNKGANTFKAVFTSAEKGHSFVRLSWTEKPPFTAPVPTSAFTHVPATELLKAAQLRLGRELFLEHRCVKCHSDTKLAETGVPELKMDAPSFEGIGSRRHYDWMARWILDPRSLRPNARMPKVLPGSKAKEDSEAIAAYLASLKTSGEVSASAVAYQTRQSKPAEGDDAAPAGEPRPLYERLHCIGCHNPPDAKEPDPTKLSQKRIAEKFPAGKLAEYLRAPEARYGWTRMPNFHLSGKEAKELEDWLFAAAPKPELKDTPTETAIIERGKKLVQSTGCLNCHALALENQFKAPTLDALSSRHRQDRSKAPAGDCLGQTPLADYGFSAEQREALNVFTLAGFASLSRHVPAEFAERQHRGLNCTACHGQIDFIPTFEALGGKLKPEWAAKFLAGEIPHKLRYDTHPRGEPWVESRMPAFKSRAADLAVGMAQLHGFAPRTPTELPVDAALAEIGRKLVGKDGGFSCISCHGVGPLLAMEVFESEGINFAYTADRLQPGYYQRWFRAPTSIDPQTKMPIYFDEGKSPLTDVLDGDAEKQISAVWEYLKLRDQMPPPKTGAE
jgi:mono/diheme cytochrome c family protein